MASSVFIAMFPLKLVIFPGEVLPLHIFEPRYKQLIGDCEEEGIPFAIPTYVNNNISQYGTEVSLVKIFRRHENGELDVLVRGERVVKIVEVEDLVEGKLYSGARCEPAPFASDAEADTEDALKERVLELSSLLRRTSPITKPAHGSVAFALAPFVELNLSQKLTLLAMHGEEERQQFLLRHLDRLTATVRDALSGESEPMSGNGRSNGNHA